MTEDGGLISTRLFGLIEFVLFFGGLLWFSQSQIRAVRRSREVDRANAAAKGDDQT